MKKTKEYYKDLLFLGYDQGERLTKEEVMQYKNSLASNQPTPENIVYGLDQRLYKVEDVDDEEFTRHSSLLLIKNLCTIKKCLVGIVVLIAVGLFFGVVGALTSAM